MRALQFLLSDHPALVSPTPRDGYTAATPDREVTAWQARRATGVRTRTPASMSPPARERQGATDGPLADREPTTAEEHRARLHGARDAQGRARGVAAVPDRLRPGDVGGGCR